MKNLIGKECGCDFDMAPQDAPVPGWPSWVTVLSVEMPMVEMCGTFGGRPFWINASKIARIWDRNADSLRLRAEPEQA